MEEGARLIIKPDTSQAFAPPPPEGPRIVALTDAISRLDESISAYHVHSEWLSGLRREAYLANAQASAAIEGNPLTLEQSQDVLRRHETRQLRRPAPDEREIVQHYHYFESIRSLDLARPPPLTLEEIERDHGRLLTGVLEASKHPGQFRGPENESWVSVGDLECTPPARVANELTALLDWYYSAGLSLPPAVRIAIWFAEFEAIHPFQDGNGRIGRALTHRLLYTDGFPNSLFVALDRPFSLDRKGYYTALASVQGSWRYDHWVVFFLQALETSYRESIGILRSLTSLQDRFTGAPRVVLEYLLRSGRREVSVADLQLQIGSYKPITFTVALQKLAKEGLVVHNGVAGRGSRYRVGPGLETLVSRPGLSR